MSIPFFTKVCNALYDIEHIIAFSAKYNVPVFPAVFFDYSSDGKPSFATAKRWNHVATTDPDKIRNLFAEKHISKAGNKFSYNMFGYMPPFALDVDAGTKKGDVGIKSMKAYIAEGVPSNTLVIKSKSGKGKHFIYSNKIGASKAPMMPDKPNVDGKGAPDGFLWGCQANSFEEGIAKLAAAKVDVSKLDGNNNPGFYYVLNDKQPVPLPPEAIGKNDIPKIDMLLPSGLMSTGMLDTGVSDSPSSRSDIMNLDVIPDGQRDNMAFKVACDLAGDIAREAMTEDEAIKVAHEFSAKCQGDFDAEIVIDKIYNNLDRKKKDVSDQKDVLEALLNDHIMVESDAKVFDLRTQIVRSVADLRNIVPAKVINDNGKPSTRYKVDEWLEHPKRMMASDYTWLPQRNDAASQVVPHPLPKHKPLINTFSPCGIKPYKEPVSEDDPLLQPFFKVVDLLFDTAEARHMYIGWQAGKLQNPAAVNYKWGVIIISHPRVGKGMLSAVLTQLLGKHNTRTSMTIEQIGSNFNSYKSNSLLIHVNEPGGEAVGTRDRKKVRESMKLLFGNDEVAIEQKGKDITGSQQTYYLSLAHANSTDDLWSIDARDGRYWIWNSNARPLPEADNTYEKLSQLTNDVYRVGDDGLTLKRRKDSKEFLSKLYRYMLDYECEDIKNLSQAPKTIYHDEAVNDTQGSLVKDFVDLVEMGDLMAGSDVHTSITLQQMLKQMYDGTPRKTGPSAIQTLKQAGVIHTIGDKSNKRLPKNVPDVMFMKADNGEPQSMVISVPHGRKVGGEIYVIRNYMTYRDMSPKDVAKHYFPELNGTKLGGSVIAW